MVLSCCIAVWDFIWPALSAGLLSYVQNNAEGALDWMTNMILEVVRRWSTDPALSQSSSARSIIGQEETLSKIYRLLKTPKSKFIGIYGMGGVGKTTLLTEINKFFQSRSREFDVVIFVTVSNDANIETIREEIGDQLGFSGDQFPPDPENRKRMLRKSLCRRKFLLLLDDLWRPLDLAEVGIPVSTISERRSKIVFTTRLSDVCNNMDAAGSKVKVQVLNEEKSWKLFCEKLGRRDDEWNESTKSLAKKVVEKCGGLRLALITVGRAMADATSDGEWRTAKTMLTEDHLKTGVLRVLWFSFHRLKDRRHQECLLYCALFPEDFDISVVELIERWIGEGFLERKERRWTIDNARDFGHTIITALKASCLLEDGREIGFQVKLHDVVREMALWITSRSFKEEGNVFLVSKGTEIVEAPMPEEWRDAIRITLMGSQCKKLPKTLECQNLRTLLLQNTHYLKQIHRGLFPSMKNLAVLDLSNSRIERFPPEIGFLVKLRYLNLSRTRLKSLPNEVGKLTNLRILDLNGTRSLTHISKDAISSLACLQSLNMMPSKYEWMAGQMDCDVGNARKKACLKDLDGLERLNDVRVTIGIMCDGDLHGFLGLRRLSSLIRGLRLTIEISSPFDMTGVLGEAKGLKQLEINGKDKLPELILPKDSRTELQELSITDFPGAVSSSTDCSTSMQETPKGVTFKSLKVLMLYDCKAVLEITWSAELPCLEELHLAECSKMKAIALPSADRESSSFFPRLRSIALENMPELESIYSQPLLFRCLRRVFVRGCPNLKKLPFDSNSAENTKEIECEQEWWNGLQWESRDVRSKFAPYFKEIFSLF